MTTPQKFRSVVTGHNFMTPTILRYGETSGDHVFELSEGRGMDGEPLYGVTVVDWASNPSERKHNHDLSDVFYSREFAEAYIGGLK